MGATPASAPGYYAVRLAQFVIAAFLRHLTFARYDALSGGGYKVTLATVWPEWRGVLGLPLLERSGARRFAPDAGKRAPSARFTLGRTR